MFVERGHSNSELASSLILSNPTPEHPVPPQVVRASIAFSEVSLEGRVLRIPMENISEVSRFSDSMLGDKLAVPQHILGSRLKLGHNAQPQVKHSELNYPWNVRSGDSEQSSHGTATKRDEFETIDSFPFDERLANVLQAADEDEHGFLSHKEISDLLRATVSDQGLTFFDTQCVLAAVREDGESQVDINRFSDVAVTLVDYLRGLRLDRPPADAAPDQRSTEAAVALCFRKELEATAKQIIEILTNTKKPKEDILVEVHSSSFRTLLSNKAYRLTEPELSLLLQYLDENEEGVLRLGYPKKTEETGVQGPPTELEQKLMNLRRDAVFDGIQQKDLVHVLRAIADGLKSHRDAYFTEEGPLKGNTVVPLQVARKILLGLDQVFLPRVAGHVLLRAIPAAAPTRAAPAGSGAAGAGVTVKDLVKATASFVLFFFNEGKQFEHAQQLVAVHLDEMKAQAEQNELNRFMGKAGDSAAKDDGEKRNSQAEMDACEKSLISYLSQTLWPEHGKGVVSAKTAIAVLSAAPLMHTLTDYELAGIVAEIEETSECVTNVPPAEHIRRWLPIVWEIRRSEYYSRITPESFASVVNVVAVELDRLGIEEEDPNAVNRQKVQGSRSRLLTQGTRSDGHTGRGYTQYPAGKGRHLTGKRTEKSDKDLTDLDARMPVITDPDELYLFNLAQARRKAHVVAAAGAATATN